MRFAQAVILTAAGGGFTLLTALTWLARRHHPGCTCGGWWCSETKGGERR